MQGIACATSELQPVATRLPVKVGQDDSFVEMGERLLICLVEVAVEHAELTLGFGTGVRDVLGPFQVTGEG